MEPISGRPFQLKNPPNNLGLSAGDLVRIRPFYREDGRPEFGIILRPTDPCVDHKYDDCNWWLLYDGTEEPFSEYDLDLVQPAADCGNV